ncbi:MAG TPA: surface-adhesin E family protein [Thermodesulfobacteriota bacterium]|nr:surface-adhesin E family protein [Thermodesulfobacteriota bacterium]
MKKIGWKSRHGWEVVLFLITFLGVTHGEAWGEDWKLGAQSKDGTIYYYDAARVTRMSEGVLKFWGKAVLSPEAVKKFAKIDRKFANLHHVTSFIEMNCTERKRRSLWIIFYDKNGIAIDNVDKAPDESSWEMILQGSAQEDLLNTLCK